MWFAPTPKSHPPWTPSNWSWFKPDYSLSQSPLENQQHWDWGLGIEPQPKCCLSQIEANPRKNCFYFQNWSLLDLFICCFFFQTFPLLKQAETKMRAPIYKKGKVWSTLRPSIIISTIKWCSIESVYTEISIRILILTHPLIAFLPLYMRDGKASKNNDTAKSTQ